MSIDFSKINNLKILVIGDIMLDQFVYGSVKRISPEAPVPVLKVDHTNEMLGGAGNVVNNLLSFGANVSFLGLIGHDDNGKKIQSLLEINERLESYLFVDINYQTVTKTRFVGHTQHIARVDRESNFIMSEELENQIIEKLAELSLTADVIIISDYDKGIITPNIKTAIGNINCTAKKILDAKGSIKEYHGKIDYITPNIKETEYYSGVSITSPETMSYAASIIGKKYNLNKILITASEKGMYLYESITDHPLTGMPIWKICHQKALNMTPVDISGAGDTVISAFAIAIALRLKIELALEFASQCAAISISKSGTSIVTVDEIKDRYMPNNEYIDFRNIDSLVKKLSIIRKTNKIGFVNGCFDTLHIGHVSMIEKAKEKCDYLIVGINSDSSIKQLKGDTRPIISEQDRATMLLALKAIDAVIIFDELDPSNILLNLAPDIVIKSYEYINKELPEQSALDTINCNLEFVNSNNLSSTTQIIEKIKSS